MAFTHTDDSLADKLAPSPVKVCHDLSTRGDLESRPTWAHTFENVPPMLDTMSAKECDDPRNHLVRSSAGSAASPFTSLNALNVEHPTAIYPPMLWTMAPAGETNLQNECLDDRGASHISEGTIIEGKDTRNCRKNAKRPLSADSFVITGPSRHRQKFETKTYHPNIGP